MSRAITESVWRNEKPIAPSLEVDVYRGQPIDIPLTEYLVQGARDMDIHEDGATEDEKKDDIEETKLRNEGLIEEYGARRGWACNFFNTSRPEHGRISKSTYGDGFRYVSRPNFIGQDCFSYVMNNGFQNSEPGQIVLNVLNYMEGRVIIEEDTSQRSSNRRAFRYIAQWYIPPGFGSFSHVAVTWYMHKPVRIMKNGSLYIRQTKEILGSTTFTMNTRNSDGFQYVAENYEWPFDGSFHTQTWPDPLLTGVIDEASGVPYVQPNGPYPISVKIAFRRERVTSRLIDYGWRKVTRYYASWEHEESIEVDVRALYGNDWWRTGNVINIHDPLYTAEVAGLFTPYGVV